MHRQSLKTISSFSSAIRIIWIKLFDKMPDIYQTHWRYVILTLKSSIIFVSFQMSQSNFDDICTGKSLSEALILVLTNPQYHNRVIIELPVQYMKIGSSEHIVYTNYFCFDIQNNLCTQHFHVLNSSFNEQSFVIFWVS